MTNYNERNDRNIDRNNDRSDRNSSMDQDRNRQPKSEKTEPAGQSGNKSSSGSRTTKAAANEGRGERTQSPELGKRNREDVRGVNEKRQDSNKSGQSSPNKSGDSSSKR